MSESESGVRERAERASARVDSTPETMPQLPPDAAPAPPPARGSIEPPQPLEIAEAQYPAEALEDRKQLRVVLRLTLDETGEVTEAEPVETGDLRFDAAVRQAALASRFTPARRDGKPLPSRILFAWDFTPPRSVGALAGKALLNGPGESPAVGVLVEVTGPSGDVRRTRTDEQGRFSVEELDAGEYQVKVSGGALGETSLRTSVVDGRTTELSLQLLALTGQEALEVTVQGPSAADRLRQSAQAVKVVETEQAARQSADLGEVLARSEGIGVQRSGGLGSGTRFSLNGLTDDQVRFLIDGLPLELAGYPFGIANVPVNLIERVEVYRGVVPIRFGADALGGAVNLVTDEDVRGTAAGLSWQAGSFGTQRLTANGRHLHEPSGLFARVGAFLDRADNDYPIDVEVSDSRGKLAPARAYRFHDGYDAAGVHLEAGIVEKPWAKRLLARAFYTRSSKELQHNLVMTVPYGEVAYDRTSAGATLRYEHALDSGIQLDLAASYAYGETRFVDDSSCVYNWFGQCVFQRVQPGEIDSNPRDQILGQHSVLARLNAGWQFHPQHALRLAIAPTFVTRTGDERSPSPPGTRDPLTAVNDLVTLVSGVEHKADLFDERVENLLFVKDYVQLARSREALPGGNALEHERSSHGFGVGDALRVRIVEGLQAKASWEWALRLPRPDEAFGDGVLVAANPQLEPERSHNLNLGLGGQSPEWSVGSFRGDANGFLRAAEQLIVLLGNDNVFAYQNVFAARALGVELSAGWTSPGLFSRNVRLSLDANATWQDFRNTSDEGAFRDFTGDRIPNRPYLFANGSARLQLPDLALTGDELALTWNVRFVEGFYRGWESVGLRASKQAIPSQNQHALALTYLTRGDPVALGFTAEVLNLADQPAFDFFGVQRPGRAFFFKTTLTL